MKALESVGVVGYAGDLGSQLVTPIAETYGSLVGYDVNKVPSNEPILEASSLEELLHQSSIVHWCAPIVSVETVPDSTELELFVLHDSVMANSVKAAEALAERNPAIGSIAIVHFLMNEERRVVVSEDSDDPEIIAAHIKAIGFDPKVMSTTSHDQLMAHSQAPLAVLCSILLPRLRGYADKGLLTPSGRALLTALNDRAAQWTPATFETILSNPELYGFLQEMCDEIANKRKI